MTKISIYLASALIIITGIMGIAVGYILTPSYSLNMYDKNVMDLGRADKWIDLRYVNAMISHHRGAMLLAEQAQKSERVEVQNLAKDILKNEPAAIAELYASKKAWYNDTKNVADPIGPKLGVYDEKLDLRFLNALIAHHQNGIIMTKDIRTKSSRLEVLNNADAVEAFLNGGINMLSEWRKNWYNI
ncbi:MAG: DUF305 domain-containing protein [Candidatus Nomurabacteria bacterium]